MSFSFGHRNIKRHIIVSQHASAKQTMPFLSRHQVTLHGHILIGLAVVHLPVRFRWTDMFQLRATFSSKSYGLQTESYYAELQLSRNTFYPWRHSFQYHRLNVTSLKPPSSDTSSPNTNLRRRDIKQKSQIKNTRCLHEFKKKN